MLLGRVSRSFSSTKEVSKSERIKSPAKSLRLGSLDSGIHAFRAEESAHGLPARCPQGHELAEMECPADPWLSLAALRQERRFLRIRNSSATTVELRLEGKVSVDLLRDWIGKLRIFLRAQC